jgi:hypothetical protein
MMNKSKNRTLLERNLNKNIDKEIERERNVDDTISIAFILDRTDGNLKDILSNKEEKVRI